MQDMPGSNNEATASNGLLPNLQQGTAEWIKARLGKVTASRISEVVAKGAKGAPSATRANYMCELLTERLTGVPTEKFRSAAMEHGTETEPLARQNYEFIHDVIVRQVGFFDHPKIAGSGASPDGLVGFDGLIEIKSPLTATHVGTLLGDPIDRKYMLQMQWQMSATGRLWCDFVSFDPRLPPRMQMKVVRINRDPGMIMELETAVRAFISELDEMIAMLNAKFPEAA